jgi:MFS family permease
MDASTPARTTPSNLPIVALFSANAISMVGNVCAGIAIPWFVLQTTGSATQTGITGFFTILPVVLAGFFGGALVDRMGYKPTSIVADLASGITVALIPLLHFTVGLQFWELMVLVFLGGLLDAPGSTARGALVPDLAALAGWPLERATSASQVVERSSRLVGAPLAGVLIALIGTANVLWIDAVSFFISAALVAVSIHAPRPKPQETAPTRYIEELRNGLKFLGGHRLIQMMVLVVMVTNFVDAAFAGVLMPVYANRVWGTAVDLGLIIAVSGGGSVLGAILYGALGRRVSRYATFVGMFVVASTLYWSLALFPPFPIILVAALITGIAAGPLNPIIDAVLYERVPADMRGRVFGTITAGAWMTMPLAMLVSGVLTEQLGLRPVLIACGVTYLIATVSAIFVPAMHELDQRPQPIETAPIVTN